MKKLHIHILGLTSQIWLTAVRLQDMKSARIPSKSSNGAYLPRLIVGKPFLNVFLYSETLFLVVHIAEHTRNHIIWPQTLHFNVFPVFFPRFNCSFLIYLYFFVGPHSTIFLPLSFSNVFYVCFMLLLYVSPVQV